LIVHSNRLTRRRYSRILGGSYRIHEADSPERALEILQENLQDNRIDLIVLDGEFKSSSGYGFCRVLKDSPQWKHVPIILIIPADAPPQARVEGLNVGADDCLPENCLDSNCPPERVPLCATAKLSVNLRCNCSYLKFTHRSWNKRQKISHKRRKTVLSDKNSLERLKREADILRGQDQLLHRISNTIRRSFNIAGNLQQMLDDLADYFSLDSCFIVLPSDEAPEDWCAASR